MDCDSSVGIATCYRLGGPGIKWQCGRGLPHPPKPAPGPANLLWNGYRFSFLGVKRPGYGVDHSPPSSVEVKERVELYSTPALGLHGLYYGEFYLYFWLFSALTCLYIDWLEQTDELYYSNLNVSYPTYCTLRITITVFRILITLFHGCIFQCNYFLLWGVTCTDVRVTVQKNSNVSCVIILLTYSMMQSPSWAADWFAASQEIPRISRNPKVHYRTHKRPPPVCILGQPNPVHIPTSHLLEIHPNIIDPFTPRSPHWSIFIVYLNFMSHITNVGPVAQSV